MRILLAIPFDCLHKGDSSVLNSMLSTLSEILPSVKFTAFTRNPEVDSKRYKGYDMEIFEYIPPSFTKLWAMLKCVIWIIFYRFFRVNPRVLLQDEFKVLEAYTRADVVLFPSRDLISLTYGPKVLAYILGGIFVATVLHKPTMLYAVQIGPFGNGLKARIGTFLTRLVLDRVNLITVRDRVSREYLRKLAVSKPSIYVTADPAFLLQSIPSEKAKKLMGEEGVHVDAKPLIGVNTSSLIYGFGFPNAKTLEDKRNEYIKLMSRIVDYLIEKLGATVIFVPHTFNPRGQDDRTIARKIFSKVTRKDKVNLITGEKTPEELKGIIGQLDLFITTRQHPLIHSTSMHVPTIAIDYTFRMQELMRRLGQESLICDIKALDYNKLASKINAAYFTKEKIKKDLMSKTRILQNYAAKNANLVKTLLTKKKTFDGRKSVMDIFSCFILVGVDFDDAAHIFLRYSSSNIMGLNHPWHNQSSLSSYCSSQYMRT